MENSGYTHSGNSGPNTTAGNLSVSSNIFYPSIISHARLLILLLKSLPRAVTGTQEQYRTVCTNVPLF